MIWQHDEFLAAAADAMPHVRLLSLDVFDTLLFRTCEQPEDVFHEVGRRAEAAGLLRPGVRAAEFAALRRIAQDTTYGTLGREPRLEDIYAALPASLCDRTAMLAMEMDVEAEICALNPSIDALVRHCNVAGVPVAAPWMALGWSPSPRPLSGSSLVTDTSSTDGLGSHTSAAITVAAIVTSL